MGYGHRKNLDRALDACLAVRAESDKLPAIADNVDFNCRKVGEVSLKNKSAPVIIFEVME